MKLEENARKKRQMEIEKMKADFKKPADKLKAVAPSMGSRGPGTSV